MTTQKGSLNLRARASSSAQVMRTIPQYAVVSVLSRGYTWSQVSYEGTTGYVMSSFLTFFEGEEATATATPAPTTGTDTVQQARVTTASGSLNLRKTPNGTVLLRIPQYETVLVVQRGTVWTQVEYNGTTGYVKNEFLTFMDQQSGTTDANAMTVLTSPMAAQVVSTETSIYLRAECSESATPIAILLRGEYVLLTAKSSTWCRIDYDGLTGYLPARYLSIP